MEARPFKPFRLFLSDGSHHAVPHSEFAWVFGSSVFVGVSGATGNAEDQFVKELSLLHITRIEPLRGTKVKK
jgi:hypothetical protein